MSDTPKTDASIREVDVAFVSHWGLSSEPQKFVEPDFARELERENALLRDNLALQADNCRDLVEDLKRENAAMRKENNIELERATHYREQWQKAQAENAALRNSRDNADKAIRDCLELANQYEWGERAEAAFAYLERYIDAARKEVGS